MGGIASYPDAFGDQLQLSFKCKKKITFKKYIL